MHCASLFHRVGEIVGELACRKGLFDAYSLSFLGKGGLVAHPYYIVDGEFVAEDYLTVVVDIDHGVEPRVSESEVV